jgi:hypothetical protein
MSYRGKWLPAELTDERGYGHPVITLEGDREVRGTTEVLFIRAVVGTDRDLLDAARAAGYQITAEEK